MYLYHAQKGGTVWSKVTDWVKETAEGTQFVVGLLLFVAVGSIRGFGPQKDD